MQPRKITEAQVRNKCMRYVRERGGLHMRNHKGAGAARGWPDDLFLFGKGKALWVEFKAPAGAPSAMQLHRINDLLKRNHVALVIDDFVNFKAAFDGMADKFGL